MDPSRRAPAWDEALPFQGSTGPRTYPRRPSRANAYLGAAVAVAIFALFLSVASLRPSITLTSSRFFTTECDPTASTRQVTAVFNATNSGLLAATIGVSLGVDGTTRSITYLSVPAGGTVQGRVSTPLSDCAYHRYSLDLCYPGDSVSCAP